MDAETHRQRTPSRVEAEDKVVTSIDRYDDVDVFIGLDVGKDEHHAVALDRAGKRLFDKALPNDETRLRAVLDQLAGASQPTAHEACRSEPLQCIHRATALAP